MNTSGSAGLSLDVMVVVVIKYEDYRIQGRQLGGGGREGRPHPNLALHTSFNDTYLGKLFFVNPALNDNLFLTLDFQMKQLTTTPLKLFTFISLLVVTSYHHLTHTPKLILESLTILKSLTIYGKQA